MKHRLQHLWLIVVHVVLFLWLFLGGPAHRGNPPSQAVPSSGDSLPSGAIGFGLFVLAALGLVTLHCWRVRRSRRG